MTRALLCGLLLAATVAATRAGELDREGARPTPSALTAVPAAKVGTELDRESPLAAHRWRGWGGGWGWGWGPQTSWSIGVTSWRNPWVGGWGWGGGWSTWNTGWGWGGWPGGWGGFYAVRPYYSSFYFAGPSHACWW